MKWFSIVLLCVIASVGYGIVHDQITVRICLEYFTIGHPQILKTQNPTLLALGWGVIATWWVGILLGIPIACASRNGSWPKREPSSLIRPLFILMMGCFACAIVAGLAGWIAAANGWVFLVGSLARRVPHDRHVPFLIDLWMHLASYASAGVGAIVLCIFLLRERRQKARQLM